MHICFWQNMLAHHQVAHIRALVNRGHDVTFVAEQELSSERKVMGWTIPNFGTAKIVIAPNSFQIRQLIDNLPQDSIHVVGGYRGYSIGWHALRLCLENSIPVGLISEACDSRGWKGALRRLLWQLEWLAFGHKLDFVLTMGELGVNWFRSCSYKPERIFPYGYFSEAPSIPQGESLSDTGSNGVELIYVGQCVPRKGIDIFLKALHPLARQNWGLTILGSGPAQSKLQHLTDELGLGNQVRFQPYVSTGEVNCHLRQSDLLVLPSRFDGWGVVVNEALMCGVPVVCSDRCGASDLLGEGWRGRIFKSEAVDELTKILSGFIERGKRTPAMTRRIRNWSSRIEGSSAASYMLAVFDHVYAQGSRPTPPWYQSDLDSR